jgi:hypothetical protein
MEIRRRVFSLLEDENGEERYYSTTEFELEFDEETGEKLFSEKDEKKGMSKGAKIALGATGSAIAAVGALELANILKKKHISAEDRKSLRLIADNLKGKGLGKDKIAEQLAFEKRHIRNLNSGIGFVEKGNKAVADFFGKAKNKGKVLVDKAKDKLKSKKVEKA